MDAITTAIATTKAARSIAAWGDSADPGKLATYCARRAKADGAAVTLAAHLGADVATVAALLEKAAIAEVTADRLEARLTAGPVSLEVYVRMAANLPARRADAAAARTALASL